MSDGGASGLVVDGLVCRGDGGLRAGPISVSLKMGDCWALIGRAGSGKSLVMSAIVGLAPTIDGSVELGGVGLTPQSIDAARRQVGFCFQRDALLTEHTALENVLVAVRARGLDEPIERATRALRDLGLLEALERPANELSGGMKRRLGLARALACDPTVLLCDDVTAGLDPSTTAEVLDRLLAPVRAKRACALVTAHDVDAVLPHMDGVTVLQRGAVVYHGDVDGLSRHPALGAFAPRSAA